MTQNINHDGAPANSDDSRLLNARGRELTDDIIRARLEIMLATLKSKKSEEDEEHGNRIKECRAASVMTKYQMIFTKIEVYVANLTELLVTKVRGLKLVAFLKIKTSSKIKPLAVDSLSRSLFYRLTRGFNQLDTLAANLNIKLMVKGFIFLKYSNKHASKDKAIFNSSTKAKINLLKLFNKNGSKRYIINRFDDCLKESGVDLRTPEKPLSHSRLSSSVN